MERLKAYIEREEASYEPKSFERDMLGSIYANEVNELIQTTQSSNKKDEKEGLRFGVHCI